MGSNPRVGSAVTGSGVSTAYGGIHLTRFPNALNLKRVLDSQRVLSHEMAKRTSLRRCARTGQEWLTRGQAYTMLVRETRNVGGLVGSGGRSARTPATSG